MASDDDDRLPYAHFCYMPTEEAARACAAQLDAADFLVAFRRLDEDDIVEWRGNPYAWILGAAKPVLIDDLVARHDEVKHIVAAHGGYYDGGEATYVLGPAPGAEGISTPDPPPLKPHDAAGPSPSAPSDTTDEAAARHGSRPDASRAFRAPIDGSDGQDLRHVASPPPNLATAHRRAR